MLVYDIAPRVEAFSTEKSSPLDFPVVLPLHQAHGVGVAQVPCSDTELTGVDALITDVPGVRIGVKTADCVPILLYDPVSASVGTVHSGWRGTVANIIRHALQSMANAFGTNAEDVRAVIGPCIHQAAFEVGDELYDVFSQAGYGAYCRRMADYDTGERERWHIDLPGVCHRQLADCGVRHVEVRPECTYAEHHRFYSARRLGPQFDRQRIINCIMLKK